MKCPYCGAENQADAKFCEACGAKLAVVSEASAAPEIDIPVPKQPEQKPKIELVLPGHEMYEQEEEDLSDVLTPQTGIETHGNMQAATMPKIELVIPEESEIQKKAKEELDRELEERRREREEGKKPLQYREDNYGSLRKEEEKKPEPEWQKEEKPEPDWRKEETAAPKQEYASRPSWDSETEQNPYFDMEIFPGDKVWAVLSYMFVIGLVAAWIRSRKMESDFMRNHLNNAFYLTLLRMIVVGLTSGFIEGILSFVIFAYSIICIIAAVQGKEMEIPFISQLPQIL